MQSIKDGWQGYAAACEIPVGGTQWHESRKCFYAGAAYLLSEIRRVPEDENEGVRMLEKYHAELQAHVLRIIATL